jgi:excisionase family DNA binding protein
LELPDELVAAIAEAAAALVLERTEQLASPWLSMSEAADYTGIPKQSLYKLTAAKAIPHCKPGSRILFSRANLDAWIEESREGPATPRRLQVLSGGRRA